MGELAAAEETDTAIAETSTGKVRGTVIDDIKDLQGHSVRRDHGR